MEKLIGKSARVKPVVSAPKRAAVKPSANPKQKDAEWPAEGPHARADLINEDATPGSGLFSGTTKPGGCVDPGAG